jgi:hypothetical protein
VFLAVQHRIGRKTSRIVELQNQQPASQGSGFFERENPGQQDWAARRIIPKFNRVRTGFTGRVVAKKERT